MTRQNGNGPNKKVTSVSLDQEVYGEVTSRASVNLSGLVNDLLGEYFASGDATLAQLKAQRDRLQERRESLEGELAEVEEDLERVTDQLEAQRERVAEREEKIDELAESIAVGDHAEVDAENPAVQTQARKLSMTPEELADAIQDRRAASSQQ